MLVNPFVVKYAYAAPINEIPKAVISRRGIKKPQHRVTTLTVKNALTANGRHQGAKASLGQTVAGAWRRRICPEFDQDRTDR
jgi:hypothetical protein